MPVKDDPSSVYRFDPKIVVADIRGKTLNTGRELEGALRKKQLDMESALARCDHKDASQDEKASVPHKVDELNAFLKQHLPLLTLGYAVSEVLGKPLLTKPSDPHSIEALGGEKAIRYSMLAMRVCQAMDEGKLMTLSPDEWKIIQERIPRNYPHPAVIWRLEQAVEKIPLNELEPAKKAKV